MGDDTGPQPARDLGASAKSLDLNAFARPKDGLRSPAEARAGIPHPTTSRVLQNLRGIADPADRWQARSEARKGFQYIRTRLFSLGKPHSGNRQQEHNDPKNDPSLSLRFDRPFSEKSKLFGRHWGKVAPSRRARRKRTKVR